MYAVTYTTNCSGLYVHDFGLHIPEEVVASNPTYTVKARAELQWYVDDGITSIAFQDLQGALDYINTLGLPHHWEPSEVRVWGLEV